MYKKGTYKLNLGLNEDLKSKLDFIMKYYEATNIAEAIRALIENEYFMLKRPDYVSKNDIKKSVEDLQECLKVIEETKQKLKEVE